MTLWICGDIECNFLDNWLGLMTGVKKTFNDLCPRTPSNPNKLGVWSKDRNRGTAVPYGERALSCAALVLMCQDHADATQRALNLRPPLPWLESQ